MLDRDDAVTRYAVADRSVPHLRVNFVASLDGAATHDGVSGPLNNEVDKIVFDALRMLADVVIVGAGTVREEGYGAMVLDDDAVEWRLAQGLPEHPRFAIVSSQVELEPDSPIFVDAPVRPIVVTHTRLAEAPPDAPGVRPVGAPTVPGSGAGVATALDADPDARDARLSALAAVADVIECGDTAVDTALMAAELASRGLPQMLCEGGPHLLGSLIEADALDELCLTLAPVLEGGAATRITAGGEQITRDMRLAHVFAEGDMLFLRYLRAR